MNTSVILRRQQYPTTLGPPCAAPACQKSTFLEIAGVSLCEAHYQQLTFLRWLLDGQPDLLDNELGTALAPLQGAPADE
jgi:hypothetical protein